MITSISHTSYYPARFTFCLLSLPVEKDARGWLCSPLLACHPRHAGELLQCALPLGVQNFDLRDGHLLLIIFLIFFFKLFNVEGWEACGRI